MPRKTRVKFLILAMLIAIAGSMQCCKDDDESSKPQTGKTKKEVDDLKKRIEELEKELEDSKDQNDKLKKALEELKEALEKAASEEEIEKIKQRVKELEDMLYASQPTASFTTFYSRSRVDSSISPEIETAVVSRGRTSDVTNNIKVTRHEDGSYSVKFVGKGSPHFLAGYTFYVGDEKGKKQTQLELCGGTSYGVRKITARDGTIVDILHDDLDEKEESSARRRDPLSRPEPAFVNTEVDAFLGAEGSPCQSGQFHFRRNIGSQEDPTRKSYFVSFYGGENLKNLPQNGEATYRGDYAGVAYVHDEPFQDPMNVKGTNQLTFNFQSHTVQGQFNYETEGIIKDDQGNHYSDSISFSGTFDYEGNYISHDVKIGGKQAGDGSEVRGSLYGDGATATACIIRIAGDLEDAKEVTIGVLQSDKQLLK